MYKFAFLQDNMPNNPIRDAFCIDVFMEAAKSYRDINS